MSDLIASLPRLPHTADILASPLRLTDGARMSSVVGGSAAEARRMIRDLEFDICNVPIVNYLSAREHGVPITAIPVFTKRSFVQGMLVCNSEARIARPRDLEGRRVGISYHGNTDATWLRGILRESFGVDCDRITWVTSADELMPDAVLPANVQQMAGVALDQLLRDGAVSALVSGTAYREIAADFRHVISDVEAAEDAWYSTTGVFPIFHTIVVTNSALAAHPCLSSDLYKGFTSAKRQALRDLNARSESSPVDGERRNSSGFPFSSPSFSTRPLLDPDPLPYGLEVNRVNLEMIVRFACEQGVIKRKFGLEELFEQVTER